MKLVLEYTWGDIGCSGISYLVFEYESKDKFVFDVLEKYKDQEWVLHGEGSGFEYMSKVELVEDIWLDKYDIEGIEHSLYTLDEWFEHRKVEVRV